MIPKKPALGLGPRVEPGFRKRSCANKKLERDNDSSKSHPALARRTDMGNTPPPVTPGPFVLCSEQPPSDRGPRAVSFRIIRTSALFKRRVDRHPIAIGEAVGFVGHADHG